MYTFFTDKSEVFECKISLQGASINSSKARLVLESENMNFIFYGKINSDGKCTIPINKLRNYLSENTKGTAKLEVIAEDTYFQPWSDKFEVKTSKKVTVEVKSNDINSLIKQEGPAKIMVSEVKNIKSNNNKLLSITEEFIKLLNKRNITIYNLSENKKTLNMLGHHIFKSYKLTESQRLQIINSVIDKLSK